MKSLESLDISYRLSPDHSVARKDSIRRKVIVLPKLVVQNHIFSPFAALIASLVLKA